MNCAYGQKLTMITKIECIPSNLYECTLKTSQKKFKYAYHHEK